MERSPESAISTRILLTWVVLPCGEFSSISLFRSEITVIYAYDLGIAEALPRCKNGCGGMGWATSADNDPEVPTLSPYAHKEVAEAKWGFPSRVVLLAAEDTCLHSRSGWRM